MDNLNQIIEEVMGEGTPANSKEDQIARLQAFSHTIKMLRKAAIEARVNNGIDDQWQEDEDFYEGIDSANRTTASRTKPYDFGGTGTGPTKSPDRNPNRSTVFVPLTRPYVDIAAARISDMYMPTDDRNWDGEPTPIPELVKIINDADKPQGAVPPAMPAAPQAMPAAPPAMPGMPAMGAPVMPAAPGAAMPAPGMPTIPVDEAKRIMEAANQSWIKARTQIDDWLKECSYNHELRKAIHDMARIGVGIMKGPFPKTRVAKAVSQTTGGFTLEISSRISPVSVRVDPWRFFPAGDCGEDATKGSHRFEQDFITRFKLRELKNPELGYLPDQIDECMEEGPMSPTTGTKKNPGQDKNEADLFEIWHFEGEVEWQDLQDAGCDCEGQKGDVFHAMVTMVNDRVIKAALHHLDSGESTYDVAVWQRKSGLWIGDGVGRQGRTAQQGVNAAVRNLMDNAGQSSRPHKVINRSAIKPGPDPWTWHMDGEADLNQVAHAMMFFNVPSMQQELMGIIQYFQKMFEDSTGLPMILQGQQGSAPETVGGMEILQNNAGIVPRNIVRMLDDHFTEPQIKRYYEYLLIHGEDESAKGDFNIHARGSSALMERASQDQFLISLAQFVMNPSFEIDPILYMEELLKSKRINPDRLKLTPERKAELAQKQPPVDPRITAAQIIAKGRVDVETLQAKEEADHAAADAHLAMNQQAFEASEAEKDRQIEMMAFQIQERIESMKEGAQREISLNDIKAMLASTSMKLNVTKDLAVGSHAIDIHKHRNPVAKPVIAPIVEPAGRAAPGRSFEQ